MGSHRFWLYLAALTLVGFAARVVYGLIANVPEGLGDDVWFHSVAKGLAHGRGFSDPYYSVGPDGTAVFGAIGDPIPTAFHPPLFPALLAIPVALGLDSYTALQVVGCAIGAGTVAVVGALARRLAGDRAGLAGAAMAAVFLPLISRDALLMSESLYGLLIGLVLLAALRLREEPGTRRALELGVAVGLAALTRSEALLLLVLLAAPIAWRRWRELALVCAATALVCLPWCVRNSLEFDQVTQITTGDGSVIAGSNVDSTYRGPLLGDWDFRALSTTPSGRHPDPNEAVQSDRWRSDGIDYALDHRGRLPVVLGARMLRTWDLYPFDPGDRADYKSLNYHHVRALDYPSTLMLLAVVSLAVVGGVGLRRRGEAVWPFLAPLALVTLITLVGHGDPRYRHAADVALLVLAGCGVSFAFGRRQPPIIAPRLPR